MRALYAIPEVSEFFVGSSFDTITFSSSLDESNKKTWKWSNANLKAYFKNLPNGHFCNCVHIYSNDNNNNNP